MAETKSAMESVLVKFQDITMTDSARFVADSLTESIFSLKL